MPLKVGNVKQSKVGSVANTDTAQKALFTLHAQAQITNVRGFGPNDATGVITLYARPISQLTPVAFATLTLTAAASGVAGVFTSLTIPFNRQSEPCVISANMSTGATGTGNWAAEVEYM